MATYRPGPTPLDPKQFSEYFYREMHRLGQAIADNAQQVVYRTLPVSEGTLSAGISANWKIAAGNVIRLSTSATQTITGIAINDPNREMVLLNVGTGVLVMKSGASESTASHQFALAETWQLSANAAAIIWYDQISSKWRGLSRT